MLKLSQHKVVVLRNFLLSINSLTMNRQNSEERLQIHIEDLESRFGQCHGSTTRRKKISPPLEVRVSYFDALKQSEKFNSFYNTITRLFTQFVVYGNLNFSLGFLVDLSIMICLFRKNTILALCFRV